MIAAAMEEAREAAMAVEERAAAARVGEDGRHTCAGVIGIGGVSKLQEARRWKGQRPRSTGGIPETRPDRPMRGGPTTRRPPAGLHPPGSVSIGTGRRNGVKKSSWITGRVRTLMLWSCCRSAGKRAWSLRSTRTPGKLLWVFPSFPPWALRGKARADMEEQIAGRSEMAVRGGRARSRYITARVCERQG